MRIYYLLIALVITFFLGLIGLSLIFTPTQILIKKIKITFKKIIYTSSVCQEKITRIEPSLKNTGLKKVRLINHDRQTLFFEENTFDRRAFSILYLMAPHDEYYTGYPLWQALMSQNLRYGSMKIFHAYEENNILFSVANALEPGYFDTDHINKIKTPGLCFFMQHYALPHPLKTFEIMVKVARRLEHLLGGTLCNDQRQPLSESIIQNYYTTLSAISGLK